MKLMVRLIPRVVMALAQRPAVTTALAALYAARRWLSLFEQRVGIPVLDLAAVMQRAQTGAIVLDVAIADGACLDRKACSPVIATCKQSLAALWRQRVSVAMDAARQHLKVLGSIVLLIVVDVMNNFKKTQVTPQLGLHHKAMFQDVPIRVGMGMVGIRDANVSLTINDPIPPRPCDKAAVVPLNETDKLTLAPTSSRGGVFRNRGRLPATAFTECIHV